MRRQDALMPLAVVGLAVALVATGWSALANRSAAAADPAPATTSPASFADPLNAASSVNLRRTITVQVVQKTKDAVVNISTQRIVTERVQFGPFWQTMDAGEVHRQATSLGSGFIVHADGYVVTNNHVIDRARLISVELADGRTLPADVVGADPDADLAVLRIHSPAPLPTLDMGESVDLMIGEPVIAVGNPLGLGHSVSTGIVSALHRNINGDRPNGAAAAGPPAQGEDAALRDLIQTDAAINPGNSGGPLLNAYGQVIAINTAIRGDAQNIGFAIPIDRLRDLIPELMNPSQVAKVDVPLHLAERRTAIEPATVVTRLVTTGAGSTELAAINGHRPANIVDAYAGLLAQRAGQAFTVTWADGRSQQLTPRQTPLPDAVVQARRRFGLSIEPVTPMLADRYHLAQEDGLFVTGVDRNSPAAQTQPEALQPGDIIVQFGPVRLTSLDDFGALVVRLPDSGVARVWVIRGTRLGYVLMRF